MSVIQHHQDPGMRDGWAYLVEGLSFGHDRAEAMHADLSAAVASGASYDQVVEAALDEGLSDDEAADLAGYYHLGYAGEPDRRGRRDLTGWTAKEDGKHVRAAGRSRSTPRRNAGKVHVKIRRGPDGKPVGKPPAPSQGRLTLAGGIAAAKAHAAAERSRKETAARLKREMRKGRRKVVRDVMRWLR